MYTSGWDELEGWTEYGSSGDGWSYSSRSYNDYYSSWGTSTYSYWYDGYTFSEDSEWTSTSDEFGYVYESWGMDNEGNESYSYDSYDYVTGESSGWGYNANGTYESWSDAEAWHYIETGPDGWYSESYYNYETGLSEYWGGDDFGEWHSYSDDFGYTYTYSSYDGTYCWNESYDYATEVYT